MGHLRRRLWSRVGADAGGDPAGDGGGAPMTALSGDYGRPMIQAARGQRWHVSVKGGSACGLSYEQMFVDGGIPWGCPESLMPKGARVCEACQATGRKSV